MILPIIFGICFGVVAHRAGRSWIVWAFLASVIYIITGLLFYFIIGFLHGMISIGNAVVLVAVAVAKVLFGRTCCTINGCTNNAINSAAMAVPRAILVTIVTTAGASITERLATRFKVPLQLPTQLAEPLGVCTNARAPQARKL